MRPRFIRSEQAPPPLTGPISNDEVEGSDHFKEPDFIEVVNNTIYFYSEVYRDKVLRLNKEIDILSTNLLHTAAMQKSESPSIFLKINSRGGDLLCGFSASDAILSCKSPVITVVEGLCASAATLISVVGKERWITRNSMMLIHQLSSIMWGTYEEFEDHKKNIDKQMDMIRKLYLTYTKLDDKKLKELLKRDLLLDAEECLNLGLVDKII